MEPGADTKQNDGGETTASEEVLSKRRRELFGDCALIEIIHLHDCLRGALKALESDVSELIRAVQNRTDQQQVLERCVSGRFKVIWSVFRAHSSAEDEFIWPALQAKTQGRINGSHKYKAEEPWEPSSATESKMIEKEEYEEDHADEERMFSEMDSLLSEFKKFLVRTSSSSTTTETGKITYDAQKMTKSIVAQTRSLSQHLMAHLKKEETQCMPLVVKHLSKTEIHDLVGQIMGKRSADTIAQIMTMAVQNLEESDRLEMVKYMKQAMSGTFFDRWLLMSGWMSSEPGEHSGKIDRVASSGNASLPNVEEDAERKRSVIPPEGESDQKIEAKKMKKEDVVEQREDTVETEQQSPGASDTPTVGTPPSCSTSAAHPETEITSQSELEKFIRAIASNPGLSSEQKNTTIQGLRDSVWKSNQRQRAIQAVAVQPTVVNAAVHVPPTFTSTSAGEATASGLAVPVSTSSSCRTSRRVTPPSMYFKKNESGKVELVWTSESPQASAQRPFNGVVPLFSATELAPSYHDGAAATVLGCPHYGRACKLRHPKSGRLYTCRLCCEQERELPTKDKDEPLDRYAVTEVMCMKCQALQPAEDRCINPECESRGKPFAKYFCRICHLYDDGTDKKIFHCPYCNCCRLGEGLGIDFRHCMRCNACVSLSDGDHQCIPQSLAGTCPICRETLFQSTEPLRGLKCGHVMHLSCFTEYRRGHSYTCPLCMRSMEDMKEYFALLDAAVRMQPMPAAYLSTMSNIYCQDCGKTGQVQYHFVGLKCSCGSYNTREMGRVDVSNDRKR